MSASWSGHALEDVRERQERQRHRVGADDRRVAFVRARTEASIALVDVRPEVPVGESL